MVTVTVAGRINDGGFWRARRAAMHAIADDATLEDADLRPFTSPFEYEVFLESTRKALGGAAWSHTAGVICYADSGIGYIGDAAAMAKWAFDRARFIDEETDESYASYALDAYRAHVRDSGELYAELTLTHGDEPMGALVFELMRRRAPKTVAHFVSLLHKEGEGPEAGAYVGSLWHRIVPGGFAQGGVLESSRAAEWERARSAAGQLEEGQLPSGRNTDAGAAPASDETAAEALQPLADESFSCAHDSAGILGFANTGPHSSNTQIYVTFGQMRSLDRKYVAFGRLVDGLATLRALEAVPTANEAPVTPVAIAAARIYEP